MSSTRACRAGERGRDLDGSGVKSSEVAVWRGSKCSPGFPEELGKCSFVGCWVEDILGAVVWRVRCSGVGVLEGLDVSGLRGGVECES